MIHLPLCLLSYILDLLPPPQLALLAGVCRLLHGQARFDPRWRKIVQNLAAVAELPRGFTSWRQLYAHNHPWWFLLQHQLFLPDAPIHYISHNDDLSSILVPGFDSGSGLITLRELQVLVSEVNAPNHAHLHAQEPILRRFDVTVSVSTMADSLWPNKPKLLADCSFEQTATDKPWTTAHLSAVPDRPRNRHVGICENADADKYRADELWPSPALSDRTYVTKATKFRQEARRLGRFGATFELQPSQCSDRAFRLYQWLDSDEEPTQGWHYSRAQEYSYYSPPFDLWHASVDKPWQGLWVADRDVGESEFLLLIQPQPPRLEAYRATGLGLLGHGELEWCIEDMHAGIISTYEGPTRGMQMLRGSYYVEGKLPAREFAPKDFFVVDPDTLGCRLDKPDLEMFEFMVVLYRRVHVL